VAALLGTYLGVGIVLLPPRDVAPAWLVVSDLMIVGGMAFASYAIAFLGRSFSLMPEARALVTGGPYSHIRHPLYVGEELAVMGAAIQYISPLALVLLALQICCQLYRMHCEETVLEETFPAYGEYRAVTARLIPGIY
jgi:protein-S-isoprenylcysteine O-methyltransferase Ste14